MSTLHAALAEWLDDRADMAHPNVREALRIDTELRALLAAHPAPEPTAITMQSDAHNSEPSEVRPTDDEVRQWCAFAAKDSVTLHADKIQDKDYPEIVVLLAARLAAVTAERDEAREAAKLHEHGYCEHSIEHNERLARRLTDAEAEVESLREQLDEHRAHYVDPPSEAGEVRLSEEEREGLRQYADQFRPNGPVFGSLVGRVESLIAARVDEAVAAALIVGATRVQPAGETRVEVKWMSDDRKAFASERHVRENGPNLGGRHLRRYERTITSFLDVVGEWEEVAGDE